MSRPYNKVCRVINTGYILASIIVHPNQTALGWKPPLSSCSQISAGMWRANSLEETLMLEKIEGRRRRGKQRTRWLDGHHWLDRHECEQAPGDGEGQGRQACCSPWGRIESYTTERLNSNESSLASQSLSFSPSRVGLKTPICQGCWEDGHLNELNAEQLQDHSQQAHWMCWAVSFQKLLPQHRRASVQGTEWKRLEMEAFQGRKGGTDAGIWVTSFWMAEWRGLRDPQCPETHPWRRGGPLGPETEFSQFVSNQMFWLLEFSCCGRVGASQWIRYRKDLVSLFKKYHLWNRRKGRVGDETGTPGRSRTEGFFAEFSLGNSPKAPAWLASPGQVNRVEDSRWRRGGSQQTGPPSSGPSLLLLLQHVGSAILKVPNYSGN